MGQLIGFLVIVVFSIVSSIAKTAKEKRERQQAIERRERANAGRPAGDRPKKKSVQSEIDSFLNDVTGGNSQDVDAEAEQRRKKKAQAKRRKQQALQRQQREQAAREQEARSKQSAGSSQSRKKKALEERTVHQSVSQSVEAHLGKRSKEMPTLSTSSVSRNVAASRGASAEIFAMLQNTEGVRNAIIANEILNRPRSLRQKQDS